MAVSDKYMTVTDAADEIGITDGRVRQLIRDGELRAEKMSNGWLVLKADVKRIAETEHPTGRPRSGKR